MNASATTTTTTHCPGCGCKLDQPHTGDWLARAAWCRGCGGSSETGHTRWMRGER